MPARRIKGNDKKFKMFAGYITAAKLTSMELCVLSFLKENTTRFTRESLFERQKPPLVEQKKVGHRSEKSFVAPVETGGSLDYLREDFENRMFFFFFFFAS